MTKVNESHIYLNCEEMNQVRRLSSQLLTLLDDSDSEDDFCSGCHKQSFSRLHSCLLLLLRIRSAHLQILGFPIGDAY